MKLRAYFLMFLIVSTSCSVVKRYTSYQNSLTPKPDKNVEEFRHFYQANKNHITISNECIIGHEYLIEGTDIRARLEPENLSSLIVDTFHIGPTYTVSSHAAAYSNYMITPSAWPYLPYLFEKDQIQLSTADSNWAFQTTLAMPKPLKPKVNSLPELGMLFVKYYDRSPNGGESEVLVIDRNELNLQWNADTLNKAGVNVTLTWNGVVLKNEELVRIDGYVEHTETVNDNGRYILSNYLLKDIPTKAYIDIKITRGKRQIVNTQNGPIELVVYSKINMGHFCLK